MPTDDKHIIDARTNVHDAALELGRQVAERGEVQVEVLDVDALNEAARIVYDVAHERGRRAGEHAANGARAEEAARGMYDLADRLLRFAIDLAEGDSDTIDAANRAAQLASMTLGRTPHADAAGPLDSLGRRRRFARGGVDLDALREARSALAPITAALPYRR